MAWNTYRSDITMLAYGLTPTVHAYILWFLVKT